MNIAQKLAEERRGRLAAEKLLELKQAELFSANRKLGLHAKKLSQEVVEKRAEVESVRGENARVKSDLDRAQASLTVANRKIEIAEKRLWHAIETVQDGFAVFDADDTMIVANRAYLSIFDGLEEVAPGVSYARILQLLTEEGIVDTEYRSAAEWRAMMARRRGEDDPDPVTIRLWNDQWIKVIDRRGPTGDLVSLGLNITSTVRYEEQLKSERERAEAAMRAKSAFLANMSHEIRTPMNGVVGMADLLRETALDEDQELYVDTIRNSGTALLGIINDVLDYSKMEARKLSLKMAPFDLERCIHDVITLLRPGAAEKGLQIVSDYDIFLPTSVIGDGGRVRQVLTNLVGNAVKFTSEGHVIVRATGVWDETLRSAKVHLTVEDTGVGIPAEMVGHIFGEFNQVEDDRNRSFEGTGLGLAITEKLIGMMGGEVWVESEVDVGSCFGARIPFEVPADARPLVAPDQTEGGLRSAALFLASTAERQVVRNVLERLDISCQYLAATDDPGARDADVLIADGAFATEFESNMGPSPRLYFGARPDTLPESAAGCHWMPRPVDSRALAERLASLRSSQAEPSAVATGPEPAPVPEPAAEPGDRPVFRARPRAVPAAAAPAAPVTKPEAEPMAAPDPTPTPETADGPRPLRVLLAEDNRTNQLVFRKMAKDCRIDLRIAANGIEAVAAHAEFAPDLIFMDISMPKMDGKEATGEIRAHEAKTGQHVTIVALTAHAMEGDEAQILEAGLDLYMTKPLSKPCLLARIAEAADERHIPPLPVDPGAAALAQASG